MKSIKQHIIEEIIRLKEAEFEAPEEIITALKDKKTINITRRRNVFQNHYHNTN